MASRKIADAHILFSAKGLAALEKDAKGSIDRILGVLNRADTPKGPLNNALLSDLGLLRDMNRAVSLLIANQRKLQSSSRGTNAAISQNVTDAMSSDREGQVTRTRAFAQNQIAGRQVEAAAVSPALLSAMGKVSKETEEYAAALKLSRTLTVAEKSGIRGNLSDIGGAGQRAEASIGRQQRRNFLAADPSELIGRRLGEIQSNKELSDIGKSQEITLAAQEIANALRMAATGVREAGIDKAMEKAARDLRDKTITPKEFQHQVATADSKKKGVTAAEETLRVADFRSRSEGRTESEVSQNAELGILRARSKAIDELIDKNKNLDAEEKKRLATERDMIDKAVTLKEAEFKLAKEMTKQEDKIRALAAKRSDLAVKEAKGITLTKQEKQELKGLNAQMDREFAALNKLKVAHSGVNQNLHKGANSSRRYNFMVQQLSYGVQDFVQVIGQTGLSGALRASANNMASLAAATGTVGGAVTGALGTIAMIGMADAIKAWGWETESTTKKMERLLGVVTRFSEVQSKMAEFRGSLVSEDLGISGIAAAPGVEARAEAAKGAGDITASEMKLRAIIEQIGSDIESSSLRNIAQGLESNNRSILGSIPVGSLVDPLVDLAAAKITGNVKFDPMKERAIQASRQELGEQEAVHQMGFISDAELSHFRKKHEEFIKEVNRIASADVSDISQMAEMAEIAGGTKELKQAVKDHAEAVKLQVIAAEQSRLSLIRLGESLDKLEGDVRAGSAFSDAPAKEAISGLIQELAKSARRIRVTDASMEGTSGTQRTNLEALKQSEVEQYNKYLESLSRVNDILANSEVVATGLAGSLSNISADFAQARANLVKALEFATPEDRAAQLAAHDAASAQNRQRRMEVEVMGFSGNAARQFGESQREANERLMQSLNEIIASPQSSPEAIAAAEAARRRIREPSDPRATSLERQLAELGRVAQQALSEGSGSARSISDALEAYTAGLEKIAMSFSGRADKKFGENQKEANNRMRAQLGQLGVGATPEEQAAINEMLRKMDEFERDFMKIAPDRSGISGRLAGGIDTFERRRDEREEVLGSDAQFDKENISDIMRQMSDSIMSFSGKVERKLGETQDEANEREKKRLDDLIAQVTASADKDDDSLIPFFELTKRKIDESDKRDLQAATGTTPIESLHSTIQDSLTGDTKEFDLQTEQRDLLRQINDGIQQFAGNEAPDLFGDVADNMSPEDNPFTGEGGLFTPEDPLQSNVNTESEVQATAANDEALKYQQASSETLSELLAFFKERATGGGLVIS